MKRNGLAFGLALLAAAATAAFTVHVDGKDAKKAAAALGFNGEMVCYVHVSDLEKSIEWYEGMLGFEVASQVDEMGWCELKSPTKGVTIGLAVAQKVDPSGGATIVFGVKDLDAARKALEGRGVKFAGPTAAHEGYVKLAEFLDPDQNLLMLSQSLETGKSKSR
jgi:predicted enzyme related to lactoylglutathione lyase